MTKSPKFETDYLKRVTNAAYNEAAEGRRVAHELYRDKVLPQSTYVEFDGALDNFARVLLAISDAERAAIRARMKSSAPGA